MNLRFKIQDSNFIVHVTKHRMLASTGKINTEHKNTWMCLKQKHQLNLYTYHFEYIMTKEEEIAE